MWMLPFEIELNGHIAVLYIYASYMDLIQVFCIHTFSKFDAYLCRGLFFIKNQEQSFVALSHSRNYFCLK